jgi:putative tryptophan/tyrosine transport system substrate-binding protein
MASHIERRKFLATLCGAAAAWPLPARAQQGQRMRRIGVLMNIMSDDPESQIRLAAFAQGLQQLGWIVGQNVSIDTRWGAGNLENLRKYSAELVALGPDVIMANSSAAVSHILDATHAIPVVFTTVTDPVGAGYVESLAHPGGNITGFTNFEYAIAGKWLELPASITRQFLQSRKRSGSISKRCGRPPREERHRRSRNGRGGLVANWCFSVPCI